MMPMPRIDPTKLTVEIKIDSETIRKFDQSIRKFDQSIKDFDQVMLRDFTRTLAALGEESRMAAMRMGAFRHVVETWPFYKVYVPPIHAGEFTVTYENLAFLEYLIGSEEMRLLQMYGSPLYWKMAVILTVVLTLVALLTGGR